MSWSVNGVLLPGASLDSGGWKERALAQNPECGDQFDAVAAAVKSVLDSGTVGNEKQFAISMSGHSNPNHEPRDGWANDAVTIQISQQ